jgi:hypothetical protein
VWWWKFKLTQPQVELEAYDELGKIGEAYSN